jgi:molybdopterin synthase catalytic subunit
MTTKYGYDLDEWEAAKAEMREALVERAKVRGMIPYSELVEEITTIELEPNSFALAAMLGEVSTEEDAADRGMLSVIVVHKVGDMQPGPGFFELAEQLGRDTSDILKCWIEELKKVHRVWSGK